uniref:Transposase n=1 Tax=Macrostomum lignano TaxID=282301 RepID=A0A1I8FBT9_9PLAT
RWPDALDKLRRQLAALLKVPFARPLVASWKDRLTAPTGGTVGNIKRTAAMPAAAARRPTGRPGVVGGPPRPVEFRSRQRQSRGQQRRLHLAATWHGGLLVAERLGVVSDWPVRLPLPSLLTGTRVLLLLLIRQPKHCLCCFLCAQRSRMRVEFKPESI